MTPYRRADLVQVQWLSPDDLVEGKVARWVLVGRL